MRQISIDTETTGLFYYQGHRIIEIGCVEIINRQITQKVFQTYINPERLIDKEAKKITGLTDLFLRDKPSFKDIIEKFLNFITDAELIMHNAPFDINFINNELKIINHRIKNIKHDFKIIDTLALARKLYPGKKNNLDALCIRFNINKTERKIHGALLDAELLARVYLELTQDDENNEKNENKKLKNLNNINLNENIEILKANKQELITHINYIKNLQEQIKMI